MCDINLKNNYFYWFLKVTKLNYSTKTVEIINKFETIITH